MAQGASEERREHQAFPVVALGASAGGFDAFEAFFRAMRPDSGMAFVLVQHLDPDHPSILAELVGRLTTMPVRTIADGMPLERDHVFVIPQNVTLFIENGAFRLAPAEPRPARYPINSFFTSLANDQRENGVAVVLSGTGSDGSHGIVAVKKAGGATFAQAPDDARYDSMPVNAAGTGSVDYVLPAAEMPAVLLDLARRRLAGRTIRVPDALTARLDGIAELLLARTGQDFTRYKRTTFARRVQRRMTALGLGDPEAYLEALGARDGEPRLLAEELMINVTQFFRDPAAFEALQREAGPRLAAAREAGAPLRVWVPGCATGEEAYSLAMMLVEQLPAERPPPFQIFASDIDELALLAAREARYPEWISSQVSPERLRRFFTRSGGQLAVAREIRDLCLFSVHDVARDPPFSRVDLVSCRNLLIYLERDLQHRVLAALHYALKPGGLLFLGPAEVAEDDGLFAPLDKQHRVYARLETRRRPLPVSRVQRRASHAGEPSLPEVVEREVLEHLAPPCAVIDRDGQVRYFGREASAYLAAPAGEPTNNALVLAHGDLRPHLAAALKAAQKSGRPLSKPGLRIALRDAVRTVDLVVRPLPEVRGEAGLLLVALRELAERRPVEEPGGERPDGDVHAELAATRERLQASNEELQRAVDELRSTNEELQLMNEELQSSNEELQTSQEELQSLNEELNTVNAELNQKLLELDRLYGDLQNLFQSTRIATLFLDRSLRIARFTPAATTLFPLIGHDVGRPLSDLAARFADRALDEDLAAALQGSDRERAVEVAGGGAWYLVRTLPYRIAERIEGVVVTFTDVTELKRAERALGDARERERERAEELAAIMSSVPAAVWISRDPAGRSLAGNRAAQEMLRVRGPEGASLAPLHEPSAPFQVLRDGRELGPDELPLHLAASRAEEVRDFEQEVVFEDGQRLHLYGHAVPILGADGRARGAVGAFVDITARRAAEEALRRADRAKDEFLGVLGHELRNPLAAVQSAFEVIRLGAGAPETTRRMEAVIGRQLRDLTRLVDDLLDVTRITRGKIEIRPVPLDLCDAVRAVIEAHRPMVDGRGVRLSARLPERHAWVRADPPRIGQVLGNLVANACKFTDPGGEVTVELREEPGGTVAVVVADTGVGIPAELVPSLFVPFQQARQDLARTHGGLGLGLALVKGIVELHGGQVVAHSDGPGRGSRFEVRLPGCERPADAPPPAGPPEPERRPLKVLVVDDNPDVAEALSEVLAIGGHQVRVASTGESALRIAPEFGPELVLCDLGLPGMDGFEVARTLRTVGLAPGALLVALSGYGRPEDRERALSCGFDLHLTKPTDAETLLGVLGRAARRPAGA